MNAAAQTSQSSHLAIGEVLALIQQEFPDVTISKIRFLESQGLIAPERTASGFRKFYDSDIKRLRWILQQQGDHFLPLKVIKKMLDDGLDTAATRSGMGSQPTLWASPDTAPTAAQEEASTVANGADSTGLAASGVGVDNGDSVNVDAEVNGNSVENMTVDLSDSRSARTPRSENHPSVVAAAMARVVAAQTSSPESRSSHAVTTDNGGIIDAGSVVEPDHEAPSSAQGSDSGTAGAGSGDDNGPGDSDRSQRTFATPADIVAALQEDPRPVSARRARPQREHTQGVTETGGATSIRNQFPVEDLYLTDSDKEFLSSDDVCEIFDIDAALLAELERYGLVNPRKFGGSVTYGQADIEIIGMAAKYQSMGVEARHLRMYKIAAEREAGFIEQLVVPLLKRRNPTSRDDAAKRASDLAAMGDEMHSLILKAQLRNLFGNR